MSLTTNKMTIGSGSYFLLAAGLFKKNKKIKTQKEVATL